MHSTSHRHLLEQLGILYGSGKLPDRQADQSYAALADRIDDYREADRRDRPIRQRLERFPITDHPTIDTVLADPEDNAVVELTARRARLHGGD